MPRRTRKERIFFPHNVVEMDLPTAKDIRAIVERDRKWKPGGRISNASQAARDRHQLLSILKGIGLLDQLSDGE